MMPNLLRMMAVGVSWWTLSIIGAPPAAAAAGDIGCIETKLGAAAMQRIGDGVVVAADSGGDPARAIDPDREALIAARDDCKSANGWSAGATDAAVAFTQARVVQIGATKALEAEGADTAAIAAAYAALPIADRRSFTAGMSPTARRAIDTLAAARGYRLTTKRHIVMLFSALSGVEFYPGDFAKS